VMLYSSSDTYAGDVIQQ